MPADLHSSLRNYKIRKILKKKARLESRCAENRDWDALKKVKKELETWLEGER